MCSRADLHNQVFAKKDSECLRVHVWTNLLSIVNFGSDFLAHCPRDATNVLESPEYTQRMY